MERIDFEAVEREIRNIDGIEIVTLDETSAEFKYGAYKVYCSYWSSYVGMVYVVMVAVHKEGHPRYNIIWAKTKDFYDEVIEILKVLKSTIIFPRNVEYVINTDWGYVSLNIEVKTYEVDITGERKIHITGYVRDVYPLDVEGDERKQCINWFMNKRIVVIRSDWWEILP